MGVANKLLIYIRRNSVGFMRPGRSVRGNPILNHPLLPLSAQKPPDGDERLKNASV